MFATSPSASRISSSEAVWVSNITPATRWASASGQLTSTVPSHPPEIWTDADRCRVPLTSIGSPRASTGKPSIDVQMSVTI